MNVSGEKSTATKNRRERTLFKVENLYKKLVQAYQEAEAKHNQLRIHHIIIGTYIEDSEVKEVELEENNRDIKQNHMDLQKRTENGGRQQRLAIL